MADDWVLALIINLLRWELIIAHCFDVDSQVYETYFYLAPIKDLFSVQYKYKRRCPQWKRTIQKNTNTNSKKLSIVKEEASGRGGADSLARRSWRLPTKNIWKKQVWKRDTLLAAKGKGGNEQIYEWEYRFTKKIQIKTKLNIWEPELNGRKSYKY